MAEPSEPELDLSWYQAELAACNHEIAILRAFLADQAPVEHPFNVRWAWVGPAFVAVLNIVLAGLGSGFPAALHCSLVLILAATSALMWERYG